MTERRVVRERVAGQSAMQTVVLAQSAAPQRGRLARMLGTSPLTATARAAYRSALAELAVGEALEQLGPRWDVLHDVPVGDGSLDHLAIGPAGVFAVHAVLCADAAAIAGDDGALADDVAIARAQADDVSEALGVHAVPLVALVGPRRVAGAGRPVLAATELHRTLARAPQTLDGDAVAALSDLADLPRTWPDADRTVLDIQQLHRDFAAVRASVRSAARVRLRWALSVSVVLLVAVWVAVAIVAEAALVP